VERGGSARVECKKTKKEDEEGELSEPVFAWEHVREYLPYDLQVVLGKHTVEGLSIDPRALMEVYHCGRA
jgi:hypothetical protein